MLAQRRPAPNATLSGHLYLNGSAADAVTLRRVSAYVEQEDALIGSLTVRETLEFAARLSLPSSVKATVRQRRVQGLLKAFGLADQAEDLIGTPVRKGISGGQKRRLSVASQLITGPKILFLDEPISGLDSAAAFEVVRFLKDLVKSHNVRMALKILEVILIRRAAHRHRIHASTFHLNVHDVRQIVAAVSRTYRIQWPGRPRPGLL